MPGDALRGDLRTSKQGLLAGRFIRNAWYMACWSTDLV